MRIKDDLFVVSRSGKSIIIFICVTLLPLFWSVSHAAAQSWYIKPTAEIPIRRGQGTKYKIVAILPDGAEVSILEEDEPYARVLSKDGKDGWMLKRYLSDARPLDQVVKRLREENSALKEKKKTMTVNGNEMAATNSNLKKQYETCTTNLDDTLNQYQKLQEDTADVVLIKENLEKSQVTISNLQQELSVVSQENKELRKNQNIKWFLAGGGTLIFGCIVGMFSSKSRKKRSSLY